MSNRLAVLKISNELLMELLTPFAPPADQCYECWLKTRLDNVQRVLKLPENAKIVDVSTGAGFMLSQVWLLIECPDFIETEPCNCWPEVEAMYWHVGNDGQPIAVVFECWTGPAVDKPFKSDFVDALRDAASRLVKVPLVESERGPHGGIMATWHPDLSAYPAQAEEKPVAFREFL